MLANKKKQYLKCYKLKNHICFRFMIGWSLAIVKKVEMVSNFPAIRATKIYYEIMLRLTHAQNWVLRVLPKKIAKWSLAIINYAFLLWISLFNHRKMVQMNLKSTIMFSNYEDDNNSQTHCFLHFNFSGVATITRLFRNVWAPGPHHQS